MNIARIIELLEKYRTCPDCGKNSVGNGSGTLIVDTNYFLRTCRCGWKVEIEEEEQKRPIATQDTVYGNDCPNGNCEM